MDEVAMACFKKLYLQPPRDARQDIQLSRLEPDTPE
jgi:hypothetical protein